MKNITVLSVLVTIFLLTVFPVSGQNGFFGNYSFSVAPQTGFVYGQALEYVYQDNRNTNELLSELIWDLKPVFYLGLQAELKKTDITDKAGFFSSLSFKAGFPGNSGHMEDRDWMSYENTNLTHFSRHTNKTNEFFLLDAVMGISVPVKSLFYVTPFISGSWMHFDFSGNNGYGIYAREKTHDAFGNPVAFYPIDDNPNNRPWHGTVIAYKQDWLLAAIGFTAGTKILYPFSFDLSLKASPLTYCIAFDQHFTRNMTFKDYTRFGLYIEPGITASYYRKKFDFCLDFNYRHINKTRGVSYINNRSYPDPFNDAGAGLNMFDTRFLVKYKL